MQNTDLMQSLIEASDVVASFGKPIRGKGNLPMFTPNDVLYKTDKMLTRLVRGICILKKWSINDLDSQIMKILDRRGRSYKALPTDRSNMLKALSGDSVSFNKVQQLLESIMEYEMSVSITLKDKDGNSEVFSYEEVLDKIRKMSVENG